MTSMDAVPQSPRADSDLTVGRATSDDWAAIRDVRLAALAESPSAFGSTLARESEFDEDRWRSWAGTAAVFIATGDGVPCGMAVGVPGETGEDRMLVAVWVRPQWRGQGASGLLLESVERCAREGGARRIRLWLTRGNVPARRLYERRGFVDSGRAKALPSNPELLEDEMVLLVSP